MKSTMILSASLSEFKASNLRPLENNSELGHKDVFENNQFFEVGLEPIMSGKLAVSRWEVGQLLGIIGLYSLHVFDKISLKWVANIPELSANK